MSPAAGSKPFDPYVVALLDDPHPVYRWLRDEEPVHHNPELDLWVLSRFADVEAALRDAATFSSAQGISLEALQSMVPVLLTMDPPRHDELRRVVSRAFTPRRVAELEPRIRVLARQLFDEAVAGEFEVMDLASAFPSMVIAELLGVPGEDHQRFRAWVEATITIDPDAVAGADPPTLVELFRYLQAIIEDRRAQRRDDMISALLDAEVDGRRLDAGELLGFTLLLLAAGFETTKNLIGNGVDILATRPDTRRQMAADPTCIPRVVEEVLRFESPVSGLTRSTTRPVRLHDVEIPARARVLVLYGSANRDERAFAAADTFDPDRAEDRHLAFGHGIHYCLGAALARLEGTIAFEELVRRLPDYSVSGGQRLLSPYIRGFASLTVHRP